MLVMLNNELLHKIGLQEAVLWGVLCGKFYYGGMTEEEIEDEVEAIVNGSIKVPASRIENLLGIKRVAQTNAIKKLESAGLIKCRVSGMPATRTISFTDRGVMLVIETLRETIKQTSSNHYELEV